MGWISLTRAAEPHGVSIALQQCKVAFDKRHSAGRNRPAEPVNQFSLGVILGTLSTSTEKKNENSKKEKENLK
jgi:hypothetical protein